MDYLVLGVSCKKEEVQAVQRALASMEFPFALKARMMHLEEDQMEERFPVVHSLLNSEYAGKIGRGEEPNYEEIEGNFIDV